MSKLKPVLLLCLIFFAGIAVGVIGTRAVGRHWMQSQHGSEFIANHMENELVEELSLTPEQREKAHKIFEESHRELQELRKELGPRFGAVFEKAEKQISEFLTPEQREKYAKFLKEKKARWRPPGGPRDGSSRPFLDGKPRFGDRDKPPREGTNTNQ